MAMLWTTRAVLSAGCVCDDVASLGDPPLAVSLLRAVSSVELAVASASQARLFQVTRSPHPKIWHAHRKQHTNFDCLLSGVP